MKKTTLSANIVKKLMTLSAVVIGIAFLIAYAMTINIQDDVYKKSKVALQAKINERLKSKLSNGITNAISIASNSDIKVALKMGDRSIAIKALNDIVKAFKDETDIKDLKLHLHTKDVKSFVRQWKQDKYGDDLTSFRHTINAVKDTKKTVSAIEVGRAGMVLRGIAPVIDNGEYLGSLEFIQNYNSIAKKFISENEELLVLTNKKYVRKDKIGADKSFGDYVITQKVINHDFLEKALEIDMNRLISDGIFVDDKYFYTFVKVNDFKNRPVGYYLLGTALSNIETAVNQAQQAIYIMILIMFLKTVIVMSAVYVITKKVVGEGVNKFSGYFQKYVNYTTLKTDKFEKAEVYMNDEIGQLLELLNSSADDFKKQIQKDEKVLKELADTTQKVSLGEYSCRIESKTDNKIITQAKDNINAMIEYLDGDMNSIKSVLKAYTHNNYKQKVKIPSDVKAEMREVMESINNLGDTLASSAKHNLDNGTKLGENVSIMNSSIDVLAQKANEQSESLQNTSVSIEEINELTKNNTTHTVNMANLGHKVKTLADNGEKLTTDTAMSIDLIADETKRINESIAIIDQISFQINILSLNAAVEAATAGEAGKGFAVVANEVRNLASKTAQASDEIKELIENATIKATEGKTISIKMQDGYKELNQYINETISLIDKVTISSKEQLQGIDQISKNISDIDKTTKQNADEANRVSQISKNVDDIAKELLLEASSKQF